MIHPNELRLLNWVKYDNRYFQIHSIAYVFPTLNTDEFGIGVVDYNNIQPVELTPDILEAAGCVYIDEIGAYYINGHSLFEFIDGIKFNIFSANDSDCYIRIKYLHQLQNLYWCLCGQELQIDLTKLNKEK